MDRNGWEQLRTQQVAVRQVRAVPDRRSISDRCTSRCAWRRVRGQHTYRVDASIVASAKFFSTVITGVVTPCRQLLMMCFRVAVLELSGCWCKLTAAASFCTRRITVSLLFSFCFISRIFLPCLKQGSYRLGKSFCLSIIIAIRFHGMILGYFTEALARKKKKKNKNGI